MDIIARQEDTVVFIEVRTRMSKEYGSPEESITPAKMHRLADIAAYYGQEKENLPESRRIDVIAIELDAESRKATRIEHIENAVEGFG
jgi:putative endonuclease